MQLPTQEKCISLVGRFEVGRTLWLPNLNSLTSYWSVYILLVLYVYVSVANEFPLDTLAIN